MSDVFEGFDLDNFLIRGDNEDCEWIGSPLTETMIAEAEAETGYRLPASYLQLLRTQNGGAPVHSVFPMSVATSWAENHIAISTIFGLDPNAPVSLCGEYGDAFMKDEWRYPDIGLYICSCPSEGHDMVALDYRKCGKDGEPEVVHVDQQIDDFKITYLAKDFSAFIRGLVDSGPYFENEEDRFY